MKRKVKGNNEEERGLKIKKMYPFIDGSTYKLQVSVRGEIW